MKRKVFSLFLLIVLGILSFVSPSYIYSIGTPTKISTTTTNDVIFPQTVADSKGYLHMVWQELTPDQIWSGLNPGIFYTRWNGDTWSSPLKISENTGFAEIPGIAADTTDTIHVVWDDETYGSGLSKVAYKTRTSGGTWSAIETLPTPAGTTVNWNARIATDNTNAPHAVYTANTGGNMDSIYWTRKVAGAWTTTELLSKNASNNNLTDCQWSDLKQNSSGTTLYLVYWCFGSGVWYRTYSGATWSTPFQVTADSIEYMRMVATPGGEVFVIWFQPPNKVWVRWTQSGGVWQTVLELASDGHRSFWGFPIIGIQADSKERVNAGWGVLDVGDNLVDLNFRVYDAAWGPVKKIKSDMRDTDTPAIYRDKWDNQHFSFTERNATTGLWEIFYSVVEGTIQTIGTAGGNITVNPGGTTYATLDIPASALSNNQDIAIQIGPVPESVSPTQVTIPRSWTFRPSGLVFNAPKKASVVLFYTDAEVAGADERQLNPWIWSSQTNAWEAKNGTNNAAQNKITVDLTGFSLYGISAPIVNVNWLTPQAGQVVKQAALLFEFQMNYADGTEVALPTEASDLMVQLKNESGTMVKEMELRPSEIIRDQGKKIYKANLFFQKDDIPNGKYTLETYLAGNLVGQQSFVLER